MTNDLEDILSINLQCLAFTISQQDTIETQIKSIERAVTICQQLAAVSVNALQANPNAFLVAERLSRFGTLAILPLTQLLELSNNEDTKLHAACVLAWI